MFWGKARTNTGGILSFTPPEGRPLLAHCTKVLLAVKATNTIITRRVKFRAEEFLLWVFIATNKRLFGGILKG